MNVLIRNVTKKFGTGHPVLDHLDLEIPGGKFSGLLGPSGCGKTTLLRIISGLDSATTGSVQLGDRLLMDSTQNIDIPPEKRDIGMVFQNYAVWPHLTVFENVAFPLRIRKTPRDQIQQEVDDALKAVQLTGLEKRMPPQLSGGQQQRVALARALAQKPKLLLLDEPLSNLDANLRAAMRKEIRGLQQKLGLTAVIVTHDWKDARDLCDHITILKNGRIEQQGSPRDIEQNPSSDFVRSLFA